MIITQSNNVDVNTIVQAIVDKSKSSFKYSKKFLLKMINQICPSYREFVYKIINSSYLKIHSSYNGSYALISKEVHKNKLTRRVTNIMYLSSSSKNGYPFTHELGHVIDAYFGSENLLSRLVILSNGKTLYETLLEEFKNKVNDIHEYIFKELKDLMVPYIGVEAFDLIEKNVSDFSRYKSLDKEDKSLRKKMQKQFLENGFAEAFCDYHMNGKTKDVLNHKYGILLDLLSSEYLILPFGLVGHEPFYYKLNPEMVCEEFVANMYEIILQCDEVQIDSVKKFLPESYKAFMELFYIFKEHVENNRRFTDLKIREVSR